MAEGFTILCNNVSFQGSSCIQYKVRRRAIAALLLQGFWLGGSKRRTSCQLIVSIRNATCSEYLR
jgi:hypothetical protein